ncbi:hypothetical protein GT347_20285 [Xylophilus rhododendri]|uniref:Uncharacterized protein n=1 Tax=Xylophilus rhododendri TaxID=2697032 RepID=A0A857J7T8_9BURK|nr:hypothetical protein [Xylophilus rhododendri]QHJ00111.1 hypothetical protein GT347_20285 [Xylophilus rhododendri]
MPTINTGSPFTNTLRAGATLMVAAPAGGLALIERTTGPGVVEKTTVSAGASTTLGPYLGTCQFKVTSLVGAVEVTQGQADAGGGGAGYTDAQALAAARAGIAASVLTQADVAVAARITKAARQGGLRQGNPVITEYAEDGTTFARYMAPNDKIIQRGQCVWIPAPTGSSGAPAASGNYTNLAYTGDAQCIVGEIGSQSGPVCRLTATVAGGIDCLYTLPTPIAPPTYRGNFFLDVVLRVPPEAVGNGIDIVVGGADGGRRRFKFNASAFKGGITTLRLWNPNHAPSDLAQRYSSISSTDESATPFWDFTSNITYIRIWGQNTPINTSIDVIGAWTPTIVKPQICLEFELAEFAESPANVLRWLNAGLGASVRATSLPSARTTSIVATLKSLYDAGADIYNGSQSRTSLNGSSTEALLRSEMGLAAAWIASKGWIRGADTFSTIGKSSGPAALMRKVAAQFNIRRGDDGNSRANVFTAGPAGFDTPMHMPARGYNGPTVYINYVEAAKATGGILKNFVHGVTAYTGALPVPDAANPIGGGGMWAQDMDILIPYLQAQVAAGEIDVVGCGQLSAFLDGLG